MAASSRELQLTLAFLLQEMQEPNLSIELGKVFLAVGGASGTSR